MLEINKVYTLKTGENILINEIRINAEGVFYKNSQYSRMYKEEAFELPKKQKADPIKEAIKEIKLK